MKLLSVHAKGFLSHVDTLLNFDDGKPYLFIGPNGAGKSSAVKDGVTFCFFGEVRGKGAGDDMIHNDMESMSVAVVFSVNDVVYRAVRTRVRNKRTELQLFTKENGVLKDITCATATVTQDAIIKILGFDNRIFSLSACLEQGSKTNFSELTPKEAKDVLLSVLNIGRYNDYEKEVRGELLNIEKEIAIKTGALEFAKGEVNEFQALNDKLIVMVAEKEACEIKVRNASALLIETENGLRDKIIALESEISTVQVKAENLRSSYREKDQQSTTFSSQLMNAGQELLKLQNKISKIEKLGSKCPTCESTLQPDHLNEVMKDVVKEIDEQKKIQETVTEKFLVIRKELEIIEAEGRSYNVVTKQAELKATNESLLKLRTEDSVAWEKTRIVSLERDILSTHEKIDGCKAKAKIIADLEAAVVALRYRSRVGQHLLDAFGKNGIPAMIIYNMVFEMEYSINTLLRRFSDKNISVKLVMEKNLKVSKELSDTFEIVIRNGSTERPYALYSGGEKFRIDLSIRLALAKILARRNNFTLETLILDEPAFLDKQGLSSLKDILVELSTSFKRIFVISHLTELTEDAGNRFNVVEIGFRNGESLVKRR